MNAGLVLSGSREVETAAAVLDGDGLRTVTGEDEDVISWLEEQELRVVAANSGTDLPPEELSDGEEELVDEGHGFLPVSLHGERSKRLEMYRREFESRFEEPPDLIRFDPHLSADELGVEGDAGLEALGVDTSAIGSAREFDAALGAVTARFYVQGDFREMGVVIPGSG